jgi:hypothetical protein
MDYVYICRNGINEELRYSLRSIEKNMPSGKVWVIGYRPDWYIGDFIAVKDVGGKFDNIRQCISVASAHKDISNNFILMNDDFFAINKIHTVQNFNGGFLKEKIQRYKELRMSPKYIKLLELTLEQLEANGIKNPLDYDIHVPITMNKEILKDALQLAYFPRSSYGNLAKLNSTKISDVKIYQSKHINNISNIDNLEIVSTDDGSFLNLKTSILEKMFSSRSKFENPNY